MEASSSTSVIAADRAKSTLDKDDSKSPVSKGIKLSSELLGDINK
jgi:hypothetical protein